MVFTMPSKKLITQLLFVYLVFPIAVMEVTGLYTHAAMDYVTGVVLGYAVMLVRSNFEI